MGKPSSGSDAKSKAGRKFDKKVQFYERVGETVAALNAQKSITKKKKLRSRQKKLKAYDLSTLSECLLGLDSPKQKPAAELNLNCKSRLKLILKETKQLGTVLNHPAFQANPLGAIHQHLQSTQPAEEPKKKKMNRNGSKKRKEKKRSKTSAGPSSMEL